MAQPSLRTKRVGSLTTPNDSMPTKTSGYAKGPVPDVAIGVHPGKVDKGKWKGYSGPSALKPDRS